MPEFELMTSKRKKIYTEWDKIVPIIKEGNNITAYLCTVIEEPGVYAELYHTLRKATEDQNITLVLNSGGGIVDTALMLMDGIRNSKAVVTGHLVGTVASAAGSIALACDELVVAEHLSWMSHNYSAGFSGKGHEAKAMQVFVDALQNKEFSDTYRGFFTEAEIASIIDGKDIWLSSEEVRQRFATAKSLRPEGKRRS